MEVPIISYRAQVKLSDQELVTMTGSFKPDEELYASTVNSTDPIVTAHALQLLATNYIADHIPENLAIYIHHVEALE